MSKLKEKRELNQENSIAVQLDATTWNLVNAPPHAKILVDEDGKPLVLPVMPIDPVGGKAVGKTIIVDTTTPSTQATVALIGQDIAALNAWSGLATKAEMMVLRVGAVIETVRTPATFKSVQCNTAAATAIWTPAAGKKFRILGLNIQQGSAALAAAAESTLTLLDAAAAITLAFDFWVPITPLGAATNISIDLRPNGYESAAANQVLNATLTANLLSGHFRVTVWGCEE